VPIFVNDEFVGAVGACGLLSEDGEVDAFLINKTTDMAEDVIEDLSLGIGALSREKAEGLAAYIQQELLTLIAPSASGA
jgi:hypothetical protein